jgi:predicted helicase
MRERFLEVFDCISIDNLHGDRKASERAPDGRSSATIFAVSGQSQGIKVGTAICTLVRKQAHIPQTKIAYRDFHQADADDRRFALLASIANPELETSYDVLTPSLGLNLNFKKGNIATGYVDWPKLPELLTVSYPGIQTARDEFLVSVDRDQLVARIGQYFDATIDHDDIRRAYPVAMTATKRFKPVETRNALRARGILPNNFVKYAYRPFDVRWLYWEPTTKLLDEKREDYFPNVRPGKLAISAQRKPRGEWQFSQVIQPIACLDLIDRGSTNFPREIFDAVTKSFRPNTSASLLKWLSERDLTPAELFAHIVATLNAPSYASGNAGALQGDWPRIPLPNDGDTFRSSAVLGSRLLELLNSETSINGVTSGALLPGLASISVPTGKDYNVIGWGHPQVSRTVSLSRQSDGFSAFSDHGF